MSSSKLLVNLVLLFALLVLANAIPINLRIQHYKIYKRQPYETSASASGSLLSSFNGNKGSLSFPTATPKYDYSSTTLTGAAQEYSTVSYSTIPECYYVEISDTTKIVESLCNSSQSCESKMIHDGFYMNCSNAYDINSSPSVNRWGNQVLLNNLSCLNNKEGYYFCCRTTIDVSTDNDTCRYLCCHITEEDLLTVTCELPQYSEHPSSYVNTESANEKNQPDYSNTMYTYYEPQTYGYSTATMSAGKASSYYGIPSTEILPNKYGNSGTGKPNSYNEAPSFASTSTGQKANEEQQMTNNNKPLTVQNYSNGHYTSSIPSTTQIVSTYPKAPTPKSQNTPQPSVPNNAPNPSKIGPQPSTPVTFPVQPTIGPSPSKIGPQPSNPVTSPVTSPIQPTIGPSSSQIGPSPSQIGPHPSTEVISSGFSNNVPTQSQNWERIK